MFNRVQLLPRMKVTIENHNGRLRLRWKDPKQRTLALGLPNTPACRSLVGIISPKGCPIDRDNFSSRVWAKVLKDVDVRYRPPGKTRSTAVSHSLAGGANYIAVTKATGIVPWWCTGITRVRSIRNLCLWNSTMLIKSQMINMLEPTKKPAALPKPAGKKQI